MTGPAAVPGRPSPTGSAGAPTGPHTGSHSRYSAGCRCPGCTAAHRRYLADWRAGRLARSVDGGVVRAHLARLVGSGLLVAHVADAAGVPRGTLYGLWRGARRTTPATAVRLLAVRPLDVPGSLPGRVRLVDAAPPGGRPDARHGAVDGLDLASVSARAAAAELGVSERTVVRWRGRQRCLEQAS